MGKIKWRKLSEFGLVSDCDRFRIGKYAIPLGIAYQAFDGNTRLGRYDTSAESIKACQDAKNATPVTDKKTPGES
jgi:hypothetical protein